MWDGVDTAAQPDAVRTTLGYLPQDFGVYPHLTPVEFLSYLAAAKGLSPGRTRQRVGNGRRLGGADVPAGSQQLLKPLRPSTP